MQQNFMIFNRFKLERLTRSSLKISFNFRKLEDFRTDYDIEADFSNDVYTSPNSDPISGTSGRRQHAVRVLIQEDRYILGKHQWFCDRTAEKTVILSVSKKYSISLQVDLIK